jgi:hypothetical protein
MFIHCGVFMHERLAENRRMVLYEVLLSREPSAMMPVAVLYQFDKEHFVGPLAIKWCTSCLSIRDKMDREPPS